MKAFKIGVVVALTLAIIGCGPSPKDQAIAQATEFARNTVGKIGAPVWDAMICYYDKDLKALWHVTGFVNGGKGPQLFVVNFQTDGKPEGDVELKPMKYSDNSEPGYWTEIERLRMADNGKQCSDWLTFAGAASSTYWHAMQEGAGPAKAMQELIKTREELLKLHPRD